MGNIFIMLLSDIQIQEDILAQNIKFHFPEEKNSKSLGIILHTHL